MLKFKTHVLKFSVSDRDLIQLFGGLKTGLGGCIFIIILESFFFGSPMRTHEQIALVFYINNRTHMAIEQVCAQD